MEYRLNAVEIECVKKLAENFENGKEWIALPLPKNSRGAVNPDDITDPLELPTDKREAILGVMEHMGLITEVGHVAGCRFFMFRITPKAIQVAREIRELENTKEEPRDIVEHIKKIARRNFILAWVIIVFGALAILARWPSW